MVLGAAGRAVPAAPAARAGPAGPRLRQGLRRRRDLVLEPLPRSPVRQRGLHLPVPVLRAALQGLELEREVPGQPEIERWLHYVTDTLDLRRDIQFSTAITSAHFDEDRNRWTITTDPGETVEAQFFVSRAGTPSAPMENIFEGQDGFRGPIFHTSRWPKEQVELAGKGSGDQDWGHRHPGHSDDRRRGRAVRHGPNPTGPEHARTTHHQTRDFDLVSSEPGHPASDASWRATDHQFRSARMHRFGRPAFVARVNGWGMLYVMPGDLVGAENRVTASDQRLRRQPTSRSRSAARAA